MSQVWEEGNTGSPPLPNHKKLLFPPNLNFFTFVNNTEETSVASFESTCHASYDAFTHIILSAAIYC